MSGLLAYYLTRDWLWVAGSVVLLANWPFTLVAIFPINKRLMAMDPHRANPESRGMLIQWGRLHDVRSALGAIAMLFFALSFAR